MYVAVQLARACIVGLYVIFPGIRDKSEWNDTLLQEVMEGKHTLHVMSGQHRAAVGMALYESDPKVYAAFETATAYVCLLPMYLMY